ncbi:MAG: site-specific integrase [Clostridia bacterium]|nr:site-specific integrase [Clostridia bacterium]
MACKKNKDGKRWDVSFYYNEWNGERVRYRKTGFKTKKEAQEFERDFLQNHSGTPKMTMGALIDLYLADCRNRVRMTTYIAKECIIITKILPHFKDTQIEKVTPAMIRKWQTLLMEDKQAYSPTYLKTVHNQMSAIMNFAVKYYGLQSNPAAQCGSMGKKRAETMQFWTHEEFNLFEAAISDRPVSKAMFNLLYWTGMRSGEMLALTPADFNWESSEVSISKTYTRRNKQDIVNPPKTSAGRRTITVPSSVMDSICKYIRTQPCGDADARIFQFSSKRVLEMEMKRGIKKAGVKRIRIHDLRHSHASLLIEMGYSPLLIAERLGHENIETTLQIYSHLYPNKQEQLAQRLEQIIEEDKKDNP